MSQFQNLFAPLAIRGMTLKNRVVMMPMGTNFALESGGISDRHIQYYQQRAKGGTGLIVVENVCVDFPLGSNGTTQLRLDHDRFIPGLSRLCQAVHQEGSCISVQLNHAGASALPSRIGMTPASASDLPSKPGGEIPRPLTQDEILRIAKTFGQAAARAKCAGFDAVEFHAGHSYLASQFLSPTTNCRTDAFGGSPENRARFPKLAMQAIRDAVGPDFPIFVRVSLDEFVEGGNSVEDSLELMEHFCEHADCFSVSAGLNASIQFQIDAANLPDGWRSYMARAVRERFHKPAIAMGNIRSPEAASDILAREDADLIGIGRGLIAEPNWVNKVRSGCTENLRPCISCNIGCAGNRIGWNRPISCTVNPALESAQEHISRTIRRPCNVVVVGAGVAGLEAACTAAEAGCNVVLLERSQRPGGLCAYLSKVSGQFRIQSFLDYLVHRARHLKNLFLLTGYDASVETISCFHPDIIVNATGSQPALPPIDGLRETLQDPSSNVFTIADVMDKEQVWAGDLSGKTVAIAGGGSSGIDAVSFFASRGAAVTIFDRNPQIGGSDLNPVTRCSFLHTLEQYPVTAITDAVLTKVTPNAFQILRHNTPEAIPFDYGYVCLGMRADAPLLQDLQETFQKDGVEILNIGNSVQARRMIDGVREGRGILQVLERLAYFSEPLPF